MTALPVFRCKRMTPPGPQRAEEEGIAAWMDDGGDFYDEEGSDQD
jgi:hypothetical protein